MAGLPKSVNTDTPIDSHFLSYINNLSSGGNTTNVTSSKDTIKQYVKTKNGIFNGAFGSVGHALTISSGELDLTANSTGAVVVRRMIQVNPESSTSDTLDKIESNGLELPYQELTLIATTSNTITLAHASSVTGTQKNIYCPGDTSYVLSPNEAVKLIYDPVNTIWLVTGGNSSSATVADSSITFAKIQDIATMKVIGRTATGSGVSSEITILDSDTMSGASATTLATSESIKAYVDASGGSTSFVGFTADATLDMNNLNIEDVNALKINSGSADSAVSFSMFGASSAGAINLIDDTDTFQFQVDGALKLSISDTVISLSVPISVTGGITTSGELILTGSGVPTATNTSMTSFTGDLHYNALTGDSHYFKVNGTTEVEIDADGLDIRNGWLELEERTAPSGLSNHSRLYAKDNGSGKTQLVVIFGSGAEQVIATEP